MVANSVESVTYRNKWHQSFDGRDIVIMGDSMENYWIVKFNQSNYLGTAHIFNTFVN